MGQATARTRREERYRVAQNDRKGPRKRQYPPVYEKVVPIALGIVVVAIVILLAVIASVVLGFFPGS